MDGPGIAAVEYLEEAADASLADAPDRCWCNAVVLRLVMRRWVSLIHNDYCV